MGIAEQLYTPQQREQQAKDRIDYRYNNAGRAYQRDQVAQGFGKQQLAQVGNQFDRAGTSANQGLARRGLTGGSADLRNQSRLARSLQDARAGISGKVQGLSQRLALQDEQARSGLSGQFNGALSSNTNNQRALTGLAGQLSNNQKDLSNGMINGVMGAGVQAFDQYRQQIPVNDAGNNYQSYIPRGQGQSRAPTSYDYLNY